MPSLRRRGIEQAKRGLECAQVLLGLRPSSLWFWALHLAICIKSFLYWNWKWKEKLMKRNMFFFHSVQKSKSLRLVPGRSSYLVDLDVMVQNASGKILLLPTFEESWKDIQRSTGSGEMQRSCQTFCLFSQLQKDEFSPLLDDQYLSTAGKNLAFLPITIW